MEHYYNAKCIEVLKGLDAVKKRPGMYIGNTDDISGLHNMIYEVIDNSIDEALSGYCNKILLELNIDGSISISDNGRGIPTDIHEKEKISAAELIMTQLHTGGKFSNNIYKISGGLHGVGISVVNALSKWINLTIWRKKKVFSIFFFNGYKIKNLKNKKIFNIKKTGTKIQFLPSNQTFLKTKFDYSLLYERLKEIAFLNPSIVISFFNKIIKYENYVSFYFKGGIIQFIHYLNKSKYPISPIVYINSKKHNLHFNIAFQWNKDYHENILTFTNNIKQKNGGTHLTGYKIGLVKVINNYASSKQLNKKNKIKLLFENIKEGLTAIISIKTPFPKFSSQTKDKLINSEIRSIMELTIVENFSQWLNVHPKNAKIIIDKIISAYITRSEIQKNRHLNKQKDFVNLITLPGKLANCQEKSPNKSELFLVEGDSAGGSAKQGRNRRSQAILALKGKILNVERANFQQVFNSNEINSLITSLKISLNNKEFDLSKLRYNKIIIMTDADVDGAHIRTLLLTFFFRYVPNLIKKGHLYIAQPPLYKVKKGSKHIYFNRKNTLYKYLENIINKNIFIKNDLNKTENHFKSIFNFFNIINTIEIKHPQYIIENLFLNNFFFHDKINPIKINKIFILQFKGMKIKWNFLLKKNIIFISKIIKKTKENFILNRNLLEFCNKKLINKHINNLYYLLNTGYIFYKGEQIFFKSICELNYILIYLAKKHLYIQRFKGLGEMNPEQLWHTTLNYKNRILFNIKINNINNVNKIFTTLMSGFVQPRKRFITENAFKAFNIDI